MKVGKTMSLNPLYVMAFNCLGDNQISCQINSETGEFETYGFTPTHNLYALTKIRNPTEYLNSLFSSKTVKNNYLISLVKQNKADVLLLKAEITKE